jgi:hypothetical protein
MKFVTALIFTACLAQSQPQGKSAMLKAAGNFEVRLKPEAPLDEKDPQAIPGRMSIDKKFHGDLEATSKGQMLAAMTAVKGSAGYVAIEQVTGKLKGRTGTFMLQHSGTATADGQQLNIVVIPDSGTGELTGLTGKMSIKIDEGNHLYEFEYTLPKAAPVTKKP